MSASPVTIVPDESSSHRFSASEERARVFDSRDAPRPRAVEAESDWIDLYQLLEVSPDTSARDLDEAIIERGADVVYFTFSRSGKPPQIRLLEKYLRDMRPILLDPAVRRRYDEQLRLHRNRDPRAMTYRDFRHTLDIREQAEGCLTSLVFVMGMPLVVWAVEKIVC